MSDIQSLMRSANPIEDPRTEFGQDDLNTLLLLTQQRSGAMDTKEAREATSPVTPDKRRTSGWFVAAAAFASVILVAALAMWLTRPANEVPPATSPTTTVDAAPESRTPTSTEVTSTTAVPTDEIAVAYAEAIVASLNNGDAEVVRQLINQATSVVSSDTADDDDRERESGRFGLWALLDTAAEIVGCTTLSTGPTRCEITRTSPFDASSELPQSLVLLVSTSSLGEIDRLRIDFGAGAWIAVEGEFGTWVRDTDPDAYVPMFVDFSDPERTADLWRTLYPIWTELDF